MIDIIRAKSAFKEYVEKYNPNDKKVELKIRHIQKVANVAKELAMSLNLSEEDVNLAELIGLLHDIGRFEQIRIYQTFVDTDSINHGKKGVEVLFEDGLIRKFIEDASYDNIIRLAILNHNRDKIQDGLSDRELLHCKIIRDADKLDIFYELTTGDKKAIWEKADLSDDKISDEIYREFFEDKTIDYKERKSSADILVSHFAYVYDFNFSSSLQKIKNENYLEKLYNRFKFNDIETSKKFKNIYEEACNYVENN